MSPLQVGRTIIRSLLFCTIASLVLSTVASAQVPEMAQQPPAYVATVSGSATIDRQGDVVEAVANMPLVTGDRLRTTAGRVEVRFPDGTGIEVAEDSEIEMISPTRVRLLAGVMDHLDPVAASDTRSAQYLPQNLQTYASTFDQSGSWQYMPEYGYVWYPRVAVDWRPYYDGYWDSVPYYGWTWIGRNPWAWPTHHYGRWGYARNAWFWIPGRAFAAAWVSWGFADPYVSWCPLGFDNRPVFALSIGFGTGWRGWTVVRRGDFGYRGHYIPRYAVSAREIPRQVAFVPQRTAPIASRFGGGRASDRGGRFDPAYGGSRAIGNANRAGIAEPRYGTRSAPAPATRGWDPRTQPSRSADPSGAQWGRSRDVVRPAVPQSAPRAIDPGPQRSPYSQAAPRGVYPQANARSPYPSAAPRVGPQVMPRQSYPQPSPRVWAPRSAPRMSTPGPIAPRSAPPARMSAPRAMPAPRAAPAQPHSAPRQASPRSGGESHGGGGRRRG